MGVKASSSVLIRSTYSLFVDPDLDRDPDLPKLSTMMSSPLNVLSERGDNLVRRKLSLTRADDYDESSAVDYSTPAGTLTPTEEGQEVVEAAIALASKPPLNSFDDVEVDID